MIWLLLALFALADLVIGLDAYYEIEVIHAGDRVCKEPITTEENAHDLGS